MKRETATAIILGIATGILIAIMLVYFLAQKNNEGSKGVIEPELTPKVSEHKTEEIQAFSIVKPEPGSIINDDEVAIKGTVQKGTLIVIQSPFGENVHKAEKNSFSMKVPLLMGENPIRITTYYETDIDTRELTVYYLPKDLNE